MYWTTLIYINDLSFSVNSSNAPMFADNTNLTIMASCRVELQNKVIIELDRIGQWFSAKKLSLSVVKTEFLLVFLDTKLHN